MKIMNNIKATFALALTAISLCASAQSNSFEKQLHKLVYEKAQ